MIRSYRLRAYPNLNKALKLAALCLRWRESVQKCIDKFWWLPEVRGSYPPKDPTVSGVLLRRAEIKAWEIVKGAKATKQKSKPEFSGVEVDLEKCQVKFCDFTKVAYDFWFKISTLEKFKRITIPCKRHKVFLKALSKGTLKKSAKLLRIRKAFYLEVYIEIPDRKPLETDYKLGIDLGLTNSVATSDSKFYGQSVQEVRKRTKHRVYKNSISAQKQEWNRVAKELVSKHPQTDFVVEDLSFKGKRGRTRSFRRKYNTWAYKCLAKKLVDLGQTEGFKVISVNPAFTSQTCPKCSFTNQGNRLGERFECLKCGYTNHADTVGAINILSLSDRVPRVHGDTLKAEDSYEQEKSAPTLFQLESLNSSKHT